MSILGLSDLVCTLTMMNTIGMYEVNPLAVAIVRLSPWALVAFKLATMVITGSGLWAARHTRSAQVAGWAALLLLIALTAQWALVLRTNTPEVPLETSFVQESDVHWVCLARG